VDAFAIRVDQEGVFLHSASDVYPRKPIIRSPGTYRLTYLVYAEQFPRMELAIRLRYSKRRRLKAASGDTWLPLVKVAIETHPLKKKMPPIHPGKILLENYLRWKGISQDRLAKDIHLPVRQINEIVQGRRAIDTDTALRLSRHFGLPEEFWLNLQVRYELEVEKDRPEIQVVCEYGVSVSHGMFHDVLIRGGGIAHLGPVNGLETRLPQDGYPIR
jgi:addiction module HigA family antidote